jgi:DUF917 family protein
MEAERGKRLFNGKVVEVERRTTAGFLRGAAGIEGLEGCSGRRIDIDFQNEWIVAWEAGVAVASSPDLICVLDSDSGEAIGTDIIRYGQRVTVLALPAPELFLTPEGLRRVGPGAFGYGFSFRSVFAA